MENAAQYAPLSSSAMQKKAIIAKFKASGLASMFLLYLCQCSNACKIS